MEQNIPVFDFNAQNESSRQVDFCPSCGAPVRGRFCTMCGFCVSSASSQPAGKRFDSDFSAESDVLVIPHTEEPTEEAVQPTPEPAAGSAASFEYAAFSPQYTASTALAPEKKKSHTGLIVLCIAVGLAVTVMLSVMAAHFLIKTSGIPAPDVSAPTAISDSRAGVSPEEFQKLRLNMSYAHVSAIIGGDAVKCQTGETVYGEIYYIYSWPGERNAHATVYVTFLDDAVSEITIDGTL